jgi:hypothetical protein
VKWLKVVQAPVPQKNKTKKTHKTSRLLIYIKFNWKGYFKVIQNNHLDEMKLMYNERPVGT